jgi:two-component system, sensor histidine kinase and response regulator
MSIYKIILSRVLGLCMALLGCSSTASAQTLALDSLQKVLAAQQTDTGKILVQAAIVKAYWYIKPDTAIKIGERLAAEAHSLGFLKGEALCYNNIGVAYDVGGNYPKALEYHFKALRIRDSISDIAGRADSENNIGEIYKFRGEYDKALAYYLQSVASSKEVHDPRGPGITYLALSDLYLLKKDYTTSLYYSKLAEDSLMALPHPDMFWVAQSWNNTGIALLALKNFSQALGYHQKALQVAKASKEKYTEATALSGIARVYMETGNPSAAIEKINAALELYLSINAKLDIKDAYLLLASAYEKMGNYSRALTCYKLGAATQDSLFNDEKTKLMNIIQYSYEIDKKQQQIELLAKDNALNKARSRQQFIGILFLIGVLVCAGVIAFLLYRHAKNKGQHNKTLQEQKERISAQAAELQQVNATKDKLFAIIGHDLRGPVGSLGMMMTLLDNDEMSREDFKSVSHDIKEQVDTVHATLENLLVWSRAQMKGIQTVKKILDIADLTNRQMGLLQQAATAKKIALVNEVPSGSLAMADADQVDFIVRNLVANAIKFTQNNGQVKVSATEANGWFTIAVKDNGCGIDEKILPTLFSMDNVSSFSSNSESGTGLGLIMCKEFVESNGGKIWVESKLGVGTVFYFTLATA